MSYQDWVDDKYWVKRSRNELDTTNRTCVFKTPKFQGWTYTRPDGSTGIEIFGCIRDETAVGEHLFTCSSVDDARTLIDGLTKWTNSLKNEKDND